ncbi:hypothetical protein CaCOL14_007255 [Colletotrichum acutatum]
MHRAKQFFAVLGRSTGLKKAEPEHDTDIDTKDDTKVERKADSRTRYRDFETQTSPDPKPPTLTEKGWTFRREAEFLWRLEQVVDQEENWRGTCMPEVKDMRAMDWGTELVPKGDGKGRGGRYQRQLTRHFCILLMGIEVGIERGWGAGKVI